MDLVLIALIPRTNGPLLDVGAHTHTYLWFNQAREKEWEVTACGRCRLDRLGSETEHRRVIRGRGDRPGNDINIMEWTLYSTLSKASGTYGNLDVVHIS